MTENGTVVECKNNFVQVRIERNSACASCGKCGMTEKQKHVDFFVENTLDARLGDSVEVEIPETNTVPLAFVAYVLPLIPALALMFVSISLKWPEWASLLMFVGGAIVGFGVVVLIDKIRKHKWMQSPTLKAVILRKEVVSEHNNVVSEFQSQETIETISETEKKEKISDE